MVSYLYTYAADISDGHPMPAEVLWSVGVIFGMMSLLCIAALELWKLMAFVRTHWWVPRRIREVMRKQGIRGPAPQFMHGNLLQRRRMREESLRHDMHCVTHDIVPRLMPDYVHWSSIYGKRFLFWWGEEPRLTISEPELIREVLSSKHAHSLGRSNLQKEGVKDFIGEGLLMANGEAWAHQRRVVAPAFHVDKLKGQIGHMVECTGKLLDEWEEVIIANRSRMGEAGSAEIEVAAQMSRLAGDVIARTEFGSSYEQGKLIFRKLNQLQKLSTQLPRSRQDRKRVSELKKQVKELLQELIQARRDSVKSGRTSSYGQDLLGLMLSEMELEAARKESRLTGDIRSLLYEVAHVEAGRLNRRSHQRFQYTEAHLMDECKTFFFTGHETTSLLLTWTLMLLASNPTWQDHARQEVLHVCRGRIPDADVIGKLKVLGMILLESLRLYTPATLLARQAFTDMKIGDIFIPKGMSIWVPVLAIHHDKAIWGMDADQFNPHRFSEGVAKASVMSIKQPHDQHHNQQNQGQPRPEHQQQEQEQQQQHHHPIMHHGFLPFSLGPRNCVGQNFAVYEAKVVLAMILARFKFHLSPNYRHAPIFVLTLKPKHGVPIIIKPLDTLSKPHM